eukprot:1824700-Amphidinium_carterae.1
MGVARGFSSFAGTCRFSPPHHRDAREARCGDQTAGETAQSSLLVDAHSRSHPPLRSVGKMGHHCKEVKQ